MNRTRRVTPEIDRQTPLARAFAAISRHPIPRSKAGWVTLLLLGFGTFACEDANPPIAAAEDPTGITLPPQQAVNMGPPCADGEQRDCTGTLGVHDAILSCYHGTQACENGLWRECVGTSISEKAAPSGYVTPGLRPLAYGAASTCADNPCDPNCQGYIEVPPEPLKAHEVSAAFGWEAGSKADPLAQVSVGLTQPCTSGNDCQYNHRCDNVMTENACTHSKCAVGGKLVPACDDCVDLICKSNPACCQRGWSCAHDVCEVGVKLALSCDDGNPAGSCIAKVNAKQPSCTSTTWDASCVAWAQSECGVSCGVCGPGEVRDGSSCYYVNTTAKTWSAARTDCQARGAGWDLATVNSSAENTFVKTAIGAGNYAWAGYKKTSGTWSWASGSSTYVPTWSGSHPGSNECARVRESNALWYGASCTGTNRSICEGAVPTGTTGSWTASCVSAVKSVCDATCSTAVPPSVTGVCQAWRPGQTDATSVGKPDLALGVPCGVGIVPVCNQGMAAAPAGVALSYYTAASNQYPLAKPNAAAKKGTCPVTTQPIPPGECINVTCPTAGASGLAAGDRVVVNPANTVLENSYLDNWSIYRSGVSCGAPTCAGTSSESTFKPVRMFIMVDRSYSMVCKPPFPNPCTLADKSESWTGATNALKAFFQDADSAGIGVAMDFFPLNAGTSPNDGCAASSYGSMATSCTTTAAGCENPLVSLGYLTAGSGPADTHEQALINALTTSPVHPPLYSNSIHTPSHPALDGALKWAKAKQLANKNETFVVVFVTDGEPTSCLMAGDTTSSTPNTSAALVNLARQAFLTAGVRTYTLGMEGSNITTLNQIAAAGGTTSSFVVGGSNAAAIAEEIADALQVIAGETASCSLPFSNAEELDPATAIVRYTSGATSTVLTKRTGPTDCGADGWYYDSNTNPTEVILCPSSCAVVQADPAASVKLELPCAPVLEAAVYNQLYEATCGNGQEPLWQFLSYETTNTNGGEVAFKVRSAATLDALATEGWLDAKVATQSQPDCLPGQTLCPVDLVKLLGSKSSDAHLELQITVTPSANSHTPTVDDWQITYTCPFNE